MPRPLYMGGSFIDSGADSTTYVEGPSFSDQNTSKNSDNNKSQTAGRDTGRKHKSTNQGNLTQAVRFDGHGTKYATAEKRQQRRKRLEDRMWDLRKQNYSDKDIAKKLEEEFGETLQPKSVASRLPKIQRQKQLEEDQKLDDELGDWHVGEDEKLYDSFVEVEKRINAEVAKLEAKKWTEISKSLANKMQERKYTGKACKERYEGLLDGTALIPIELDPDQESRRILREARIAENKRVRAEAEAAAIRAAEAIRQEKIQKKAKEMQIREARQAAVEANKAEKEADRQLKRQIKEAKSQVVRARKDHERQEKLKKIEWWKTREMENLVYAYYTGRVLQRKQKGAIMNDNELEDYVSDDELPDATPLQKGNKRGAVVRTTTPAKHIRRSDNGKSKRSGQAPAPKQPAKKVRVSKQTLISPRSVLTMEELDFLLAKRDMPRRTADETHPEVVARLAAADNDMDMQSLKALLTAEFIPLKGSRKTKALRLQEHDAKHSAAGEEGISSTDLEFKKSYEGYYGKGARFIGDDGQAENGQ